MKSRSTAARSALSWRASCRTTKPRRWWTQHRGRREPQPTKLMGVESRGMLLAHGHRGRRPCPRGVRQERGPGGEGAVIVP
jgi:hypothetical protein